MSEQVHIQTRTLSRALVVESLGTVGLALTVLPLTSLLLLRAWAQPGGWLLVETGAPTVALCLLVLPLVAMAGSAACLASLVLMRQRWLQGWERALLGLLMGGLMLGCWGTLVQFALGA